MQIQPNVQMQAQVLNAIQQEQGCSGFQVEMQVQILNATLTKSTSATLNNQSTTAPIRSRPLKWMQMQQVQMFGAMQL